MADLLLKVGARSPDPADWQDGDVLHAMTDHRRRAVCARSLWRTTHRRCSSGEYQAGGLHEQICAAFHRTRFTAVSRTEVLVEREGEKPYIVGPRLNERREAIDLPAFLNARRASGKKLFRGPGGSVFWFGNEAPLPAEEQLDILWGYLEADGHRCPSCFPFGSQDVRTHYAIRCEDIAAERAADLEKPVTFDFADPDTGKVDQRIVKRRRYRVRIDALPHHSPESLAKVRDPGVLADWRDRPFYTPYRETEIVEVR